MSFSQEIIADEVNEGVLHEIDVTISLVVRYTTIFLAEDIEQLVHT